MTDWKPGDADRRQNERGQLEIDAQIAAKVVSDAAVVALKTIADATANAQTSLMVDISYIKKDISEIKTLLENKYVTKEAFGPVKSIAFGMVALVLVAVVGSLLTMVLTRGGV